MSSWPQPFSYVKSSKLNRESMKPMWANEQRSVTSQTRRLKDVQEPSAKYNTYTYWQIQTLTAREETKGEKMTWTMEERRYREIDYHSKHSFLQIYELVPDIKNCLTRMSQTGNKWTELWAALQDVRWTCSSQYCLGNSIGSRGISFHATLCCTLL